MAKEKALQPGDRPEPTHDELQDQVRKANLALANKERPLIAEFLQHIKSDEVSGFIGKCQTVLDTFPKSVIGTVARNYIQGHEAMKSVANNELARIDNIIRDNS